MAAVPRIDPKTIFSPDEWAGLTRRPLWIGPALVAHAWSLIAAAAALFLAWPNPVTYILAIMVIGARQLGLAILMHEAAHGGLSRDQRVNDFLGDWLCAAPVGADLKPYRDYHLRHHKYTEQPEDPDIGLSAPFPITRKSLSRKIVRDLTGQTFFKQRFGPLLARVQGKRRLEPRDGAVVSAGAARFWMFNAALFAAFAAFGVWWAYLALWIVPMATWFPLVTRLRNIAEHACVGKHADPFRHARTTYANALERLFIAPYWVHYHAEHHVFMHVPCWNLERAHRLLIAKGYGARMDIQSGNGAVLQIAAPA
jgi:fatty acid desaturase